MEQLDYNLLCRWLVAWAWMSRCGCRRCSRRTATGCSKRAAGSRFGQGALHNFAKERDNPLNRNDYIHTKFMLIDPLSDDPLVVTGSANFSRPSQRSNDENMLIIRGDTRVADIYFGEYMRIFDHHYARYLVRKLSNLDRSDPDAGFLKEATKDWLPAHFKDDSYKAKRRQYFAGTQ